MRPDALAQEVAKVLTPLLPEAAELDTDAVAALLGPPPRSDMGDLAFPCFRLAKALRNAPAKIAVALAADFKAALEARGGKLPLIAAADAAGPYLNLRLHASEAAALVLPAWARGEHPDFRGTPAHSDRKIMVEYSQPNTHKAFHVGHMRNLCLGDALVRLLRATGHEVVAANYLGDVGTHVAKCLWGHEALFDLADPPGDSKAIRGEWLGTVYSTSSTTLDDWRQAGEAGDAQAQAKYEAARARMSEILRGIETREPTYRALWERTRQWSLDAFDEIYAWTGVHFDRVFYESEVDEPGLALVEEFLAKGVFVESRGAIGIENPEIEHMPFFMLRKSDGTGLYSTKDLALARIKFEEFGIDRSIYVVDARQSDHFRQVFLTLKKMGFAQAQLCEHVAYEMVELPDGPMASRDGNVITFRALREQLAATLDSGYFAEFRAGETDAETDGETDAETDAETRETWTEAEIATAVHEVSLGAIKYGMLARDNNQKIVFDMAKWTQVRGGDGGPTLQYVSARSASLLRKAEARGKGLDPAMLTDSAALTAGTLEDPTERALILAIDNLPNAVAQAAGGLRPSVLCSGLYALAKAYNRFQQTCNVIHQDDQSVLQARLLLVKASHEALSWGLSLLGIPAPQRM